jgi:hypothetical protein
MEPRLDRAQFWILSGLATYLLPLNVIGLPDESDTEIHSTMPLALNRRGPGVPVAALARTIVSMLRCDWVEIIPGVRERIDDVRNMTPRRVERELLRRGAFSDGPFLGLTATGGATWERFARPRWDRFVDDGSVLREDLPDAWQREVITLDGAFLQRYMGALREQEEITPRSESYDVLEDWQPTYWKPAGRGYRCVFIERERDTPSIVDRGEAAWLRKLWCEWR